VIVKRLSEAGYRALRIAAVTGLRPWQVERSQAEVALRPLALLQGLLARCWELDGQLKSGRAVPELAIEQLVAEICLRDERTTLA
jgi:DNA polymerase III delta subunit